MQESPQPLTHDLSTNLAALQAAFHTCCDFVTHSFEIPALNRRAALLFIDGLVNQTTINELALKPLVYFTPPARGPEASACETLDAVAERLLLFSEVKTIHTLEEARLTCLSGDALLLVDGMEGALECNAKGWERRSITEPQTETVIRGPREGFVETLRANTSLIRRRLRTQDLRVESMSIGERTSTPVSILYIEGIANPKLVTEVKRRLGTIHTDMVSNSGYIAEFIEDAPHSLFETVGYTEKPDVVAGKLMEGRVALIVDGTPFVLTAPLLFIEHFQSAEDYAIRPFYATFLRVLRLIAFVISMLAPAIFVAVVTYHQELIPNALLFTMAAAGAGLPFPSGVETALMLMIFEILKEAGVRLPRPVGQAISIVGALVMGQAAIQAGLVGAPVVILIALTGVASFAVPNLANAVSMIRWLLLILAAVLGGYGLTLGLIIALVHLSSLKSFGTPILAPIAPLNPPDLKDTFWRAPLWWMRTRPAALHPMDIQRQSGERPNFEQDANPENPKGGGKA